jgi:cytochrome c peroxidase
LVAAVAVCTLAQAGCGSPAEPDLLRVPRGFPRPRIPADNPLSAAKVELGRFLFYDKRLSENGMQSCASCHEQEKAFTDGRAQAVGSTGQTHPRGSMSLANVAYFSALTWANPLQRSLEEQALLPLFGETPVELGWAGKEQELLTWLRADTLYAARFAAAFPVDTSPVSLGNLTKALAAFERTLISGRSPYDRYVHDRDPTALSESARRGMDLFFGEKFECHHCHGSFALMDSTVDENTVFEEAFFHNTGLYNLDARGSYPQGGQGVYEISGKDGDRGRFRAPSLRNIAVTAPYMHDGSITTLTEALLHYARGGRRIEGGSRGGDGSLNPNKSAFVRFFQPTDQELADVLAFLQSLTDSEFLRDPRFSDPFLPR